METTSMNRTQSPRIKHPVEFDLRLPPLETFHLDNGLPVHAVRGDEQDTLQLEWVFDAGNWYEPANLVASISNALLKNGTRKHSALQINEMVEYYGAFLQARCNHEFASLTLHCLEKHAISLLPVIREILTEASMPDDELETCRRNGKQRLAVNLEKCDFVANQLIEKYLFGEQHPYGRYTTMEAYDALQRDQLYAFYQHHYSFNTCRIFVAGKLPHRFREALNGFFGADEWNGRQELQAPQHPVLPAAERRYRVTRDAEGVQGAIRIARHFPDRRHPDVPKMQVLSTVLGGYFGSRLMSNIREDKGYTYGIHSVLYLYNHLGEFSILTEAGRDVCEAAVTEIYKELRRLREEPVPAAELDLVRNYMIGSLLGDLDGSFNVIRRWKTILLAGLDEQYFYNSVRTIKSVTAAELQQLAAQYLQPDDFYELVVI